MSKFGTLSSFKGSPPKWQIRISSFQRRRTLDGDELWKRRGGELDRPGPESRSWLEKEMTAANILQLASSKGSNELSSPPKWQIRISSFQRRRTLDGDELWKRRGGELDRPGPESRSWLEKEMTAANILQLASSKGSNELSANFLAKDNFSSAGLVIRAVLAELVGTGLLVLFGCGACLAWGGPAPTPLQIAISFGFIIASMVQAIGHVSGCNINPAVTVGLLFSGRIGLVRAAFYIPAQCVGAIAGAAILKGITPEQVQGTLGTAGLSVGVSPVQGMLVEGIVSFVLLLVVSALTDPHRSDVGNAAPVAVGIAITCSHIFAIPFTGSSMNPARALGPATMSGLWDDHWIYWVGPLVGGALGGLLYRLIFAAPKDEESSYDL